MKRILVFFVVVLVATASALAQTAAEKIAAGRTALAAHDVSTARTRFSEALAIEPANQTAATLLGFMRVANLAGQSASSTFLNSLNVATTGRDVYRWDAPLPHDTNGNIVLPLNYNLTTVAAFWQASVLPETAAARANLALVTNSGFLLTLYPNETRLPVALTLDYGDVLLSRAGLSALEFLLHFLSGQNLSVNLDAVNRLNQQGLMTIPRLLSDNPNFFLVGSTSERTAAKASLLETIQLYRQASTFIRTARPTGVRRLFMLAPADLPQESDFRAQLDKIERSLTEPVQVSKSRPHYATIGPIFGPTWSARAQLPTFSTTGFDLTSITDPTLGGVAAGATREEIAGAFNRPELGWQWASPTPQGNTLVRHLALANGKRIVAGEAGTVFTSDDGTTWTLRTLPDAGHIRGLAEGTGSQVGKVVAAASDGLYLTSDSGVTWQRVFSGNGGQYRAVVFGGGKFVAVGDYGITATSTDGLAWFFSYGQYTTLYDVIYAGSFYLGVGYDPSQNKAVVVTSTDGLNWTNRYTSTGTGFAYTGVAQGTANFVVVGGNNQCAVSANTTATTAWTAGTVLATGSTPFNSVIYRSAAGFFVAAGANGTVVTVTDTALAGNPASNWTSLTTGEAASLYGIGAAADGVYFAGTAGVILRSTNLTASTGTFARALTQVAAAAPNVTLLGAKAIDGVLYAVGSNGTIVRSSNGTTFTPVTSSGTTSTLWAIIKQGGTFYAVGDGGTIVTSTDGLTWTSIVSGTTAALRAIEYLNGQFVATGTGLVLTSSTGATSTWTTRTLSGGGTFYGVAYGVVGGTGTYVAAGGNGSGGSNGINFVFTSTDNGVTWNRQLLNTASTFRGVVFNQGVFTAAGLDGAVYRSTDGIVWNFVETGAYTNILGLKVLNGRYYALQSSLGSYESLSRTSLLVSTDGLHWVAVQQPTANSQYGIEYFNDGSSSRLYTFGASATVLRTTAIPAVSTPVVAVITTSRQAKQGDNLALAVGTNRDGGETFAWSKGGTAITGANGPVLPLTNIQTADAGSYVLTVTNAAGSASAAAIALTVDSTLVAPYITQQPVSRVVNVGLTARFSVVANGTVPFTYQWKKDGVNLVDGANVSGATTATLVLSNVQYTDVAAYSVVVSGVAPAATSESALLTVDSNPAYTFSTVAGTPGAIGAIDATGAAARFQNPGGVAADAAGNLYVADSSSHTIRKIVLSTGVVTTYAGLAGTAGLVNATTTAARFNSPTGLAYDAVSGSLFVADLGNGAIRKVSLATGAVTTFASGVGQPNYIVSDSSGNVYFTTTGHVVRKVTADGVTSTVFAGSVGVPSMSDGVGSAARFNNPQGIGIDAAGNLFVADNGNQIVRKITPGATVSTFAGMYGLYGYDDGPAGTGKLYNPVGLAVDAAGYVYVSESVTNRIRKISPSGTIRTLGGELFEYGSLDGLGRNARFGGPRGLALDSSGNLYVADTSNQTIRMGVPSASLLVPAIGTPLPDVSASVGGTVTFTVDATGATSPAPLTYQWRRDGTSVGSGSSLTLTNLTSGNAGNYTVQVTNGQGSALSPIWKLTVTPAMTPPTIASFTPTTAGGGQSFVITGTGFSGASRVAVNGIDAVYSVDSATQITAFVPMLATTGSIIVTTGAGTVTSQTSLTVPQTRALINQSTRVALTLNNPEVVANFTVQGSTPKSILLRAVGPTLATSGVSSVLTDPILTLHDSTGALVATNDDWGGGTTLSAAFASVGAMALPTSSKDSAILMTLNPGTYAARATGVGGATGVVLLEVYDADTTARVNFVAARTMVGTSSDILTSGFVISGSTSQTVLVRALGPTLGVAGALANPLLSVYNSTGALVATNDNWSMSEALISATDAVGAMPLSRNSTESALLLTLSPGAYTAQVSGVGSTTGIGHVEVFQVDGYTPASRPALLVPARSIGLELGSSLTLAAPAIAKPNFVSYQWRKGGSAINGATNQSLTISSATTNDSGTYSVVATNTGGATTSADYVVAVGNGATFTVMPALAQSVVVGGSLSFGVTVAGSPAPALQWQRNGVDVPGATGATITITGASQANAGTYRVVATNSVNRVVSDAITVAVIERALLNLLSRVNVPARGSVGGSFSIEGGPKNILVRGVGPSLDGTGNLVDPRITLLNASFVPINSNDDWGTNANAAAITTAMTTLAVSPALTVGSKDAALLVTLNPGTYTVVLDGVGGTAGTVQLDLVDADSGVWPRVAMLTMRGSSTWTANLNLGFNISGTAEQKYLIRSLGPTLGYNSAANNGVLVDPYMYVYRGTTLLASDDDTYEDTTMLAAITQVGAMPRFARNNYFSYYDNYDSSLLLTLQPGSYTARTRPFAESEGGEMLFEIFAVDDQHPSTIAPAITYMSPNQNALPNGDFALGVVVVAKPAPTFQWRRYVNGTPTPITGATANILRLSNLQSSDSGSSFDVVVTSGTNTITSPQRTVSIVATYHSADTNRDGQISLAEVTRVMQLHNYSVNGTRTGEYHTQADTEDGFAPGPGPRTSYHSADTDRDGRISGAELARVIELYSYVNGTVRTGQYHPQIGTEDNFAPGPGATSSGGTD